ncbi:MAG: hypothetical protein ABIP20_18265 [Chthoniobacteraceae bacterium]
MTLIKNGLFCHKWALFAVSASKEGKKGPAVFRKRPAFFQKASAFFQKALAVYRKASAVFRKASAVFGKALAFFRKASAFFRKALALFRKALAFFRKASAFFPDALAFLPNASAVFRKASAVFRGASAVWEKRPRLLACVPKVRNETRRRRDAEEEDRGKGSFAPFSLRLRVSAFQNMAASNLCGHFRSTLLNRRQSAAADRGTLNALATPEPLRFGLKLPRTPRRTHLCPMKLRLHLLEHLTMEGAADGAHQAE